MAKVIGILSLKGGVGKTSSVVSLGAAMADLGKKVLLVDANLSAPNLGLHLNVVDPEKTLHDVLKGEANITETIVNLDNFDLIPASIFNKSKLNALKLRDKLNFLKDRYDYILIDSSPSLTEETLAAILASDEILVVTTPDVPTLSMTIKAIKVAKQRGTPIIGMIVNKVHDKNFEIPIREVEKSAGVPVMAVIPHDVGVLKALSDFEPYTHDNNSRGSTEYKKLAAALMGQKYKSFSFREMLGLTPSLQDVNRVAFYTSVFQ
ncbi:AAA family ATPase [Candidatus Pacearchaeota archaeon]|nr:AAA family ATPase [Candidatus Pacearchaeota archaeon]